MEERDWQLVIKLEVMEYKNPTNAFNDICEQLSASDWFHDIELICCEPLVYNGVDGSEPMYDDLTSLNWNMKRNYPERYLENFKREDIERFLEWEDEDCEY